MMIETSTITSKGQTTIPISIRRLLGLGETSEIAYIPLSNGEGVFMRPVAQNNVADRRARLEAAIKKTAGTYNMQGKSTDEIMRELRGDD